MKKIPDLSYRSHRTYNSEEIIDLELGGQGAALLPMVCISNGRSDLLSYL